jgi:hypothetical protein
VQADEELRAVIAMLRMTIADVEVLRGATPAALRLAGCEVVAAYVDGEPVAALVGHPELFQGHMPTWRVDIMGTHPLHQRRGHITDLWRWAYLEGPVATNGFRISGILTTEQGRNYLINHHNLEPDGDTVQVLSDDSWLGLGASVDKLMADPRTPPEWVELAQEMKENGRLP